MQKGGGGGTIMEGQIDVDSLSYLGERLVDPILPSYATLGLGYASVSILD